MHSIDLELQERGQKMVDRLMAYEADHPRQGPDADGRPYDPVRDVIVAWLEVPALAASRWRFHRCSANTPS